MAYLAEPLNAGLNRSVFSCGKPALDDYLRDQAGQDMRKRLAAVFVWTDITGGIIGYYSLSNSSIPRSNTPPEVEKKMPSAYDSFSVTLLGRLAVDTRHQRQGNGQKLLIDALRRSADVAKSTISSIAVVLDPFDEDARRFYLAFGFIELPSGFQMFMPMKMVEQTLREIDI
jgi:GNAT superfamily N-acetyltransferase